MKKTLKKRLTESVGKAFATRALDTEAPVTSKGLEDSIKKYHSNWDEKKAGSAGSSYMEHFQDHVDEHEDEEAAHNHAIKKVGIHPEVGKHLNKLAKEIF